MDDSKIPLNMLYKKIQELSVNIEKMRIAEYIKLLDNPKRLLYINFIAGIARGFGMAVGFTLLGALLLYLLQKLLILNLPLLGDFIADIVKIVQQQL
ncbi:MAG: hypothetical protein PWQ82_697 [Thermosediminibacterales bacterium]|nr:hypothetical protein [Thermosediminibacterales bacterium]MDK2836078.1 hypothetical protein [Thermosediminibacterales bacterium]